MRKWLPSLCTVALLAGLFVVIQAGSASAAAQCVFTPRPPSRVVVRQSVVGMRIPLGIAGVGCRQDLTVSTNLVHSTDSYFPFWTAPGVDVESVLAGSIVPGRYRTTGSTCSVFDANFNQLSCRVAAASTVIKFGARVPFSARRHGRRVSFTARTTRFTAFSGFQPQRARISIQRRRGSRWVTIHRQISRGSRGFTWTTRRAAAARYRAVSVETGLAFSATSRVVRR